MAQPLLDSGCMPPYTLLVPSIAGLALSACQFEVTPAGPDGDTPAAAPRALVYRGPAGCDDCSEVVAAVLASSRWGFEIEFVGPNEPRQITADSLASARLYAQPDGVPDLDVAYAKMETQAPLIRAFVDGGGRYLGFGLGGYLAGATPGFDLIHGDTESYTSSPNAAVTGDAAAITTVSWRGTNRFVYFENDPLFVVDASATIVATYSTGPIAALVTQHGQGRVAVCGPHPEADASWYQADNLVDPDGLDADLAHDLIDAVMQ